MCEYFLLINKGLGKTTLLTAALITTYGNVLNYFYFNGYVSVYPGQQENSQWKRTVCHRSPGAQVKVAAVVKTSMKTCTTPKPAPRKRRKIHPSGFRGKGKQISTSSFAIYDLVPL